MSLLTNLVEYWKLDEASGTRFASYSTHDLVDNNTVTSATGKINTAASFAVASIEYLSVASGSWMNVAGQDFFVSAWAKPTTTPGYAMIFSRGGGNFEVRLYFNGASFELNLADSATAFAGTVSAGNWYHILAWRSVVDLKIYIRVNNGTTANATYSIDSADSANALNIGDRLGSTTLSWDGLIDEVGFWVGRVPTTQEQDDLWNGGAGLPYSSFGGAAAGPVGRALMLRQGVKRAAYY